MSDLEYKNKYLKYKNKYLNLKNELEKVNLEGGGVFSDGFYVFFTEKELKDISGYNTYGNELNWVNNLGNFYFIKIGKAKFFVDIFNTYNTIYNYNQNTQKGIPIPETKQTDSYIEDINDKEIATKVFYANKKLFQNKNCFMIVSIVNIEKNKITVKNVYGDQKKNKCFLHDPNMSGKDM